MFEKRKTEVLVVGGGPVGLYTALLFAERGIQVQVVEEQWKAASRSYALALHPASLRLLAELDLSERLVSSGYRVDTLAFYDHQQRCGELKFRDLGGSHPFVLVLPQESLEALLRERLSQRRVKVLWNHRVAEFAMDEDIVTARIEKLGKDSSGYAVARTEWVVDKVFENSVQFIIGADGHRSTIRRSLGIDFETVGPGQTFAVFEFTSDAAIDHEMRIVFGSNRTSVLWPMGNGRFRWSFEIDAQKEIVDPRVKSRLFVQVRDESYPYVSEERLEELIAERAEWFGGGVEELLWSAVIRFERKLASSFGRQRAWLVGDAAHLAAPIAIQSMNIGFREASLLTRQVNGILRGGSPISSIATYESKSVSEWQRLVAGVTAEENAEDWVRSYAARIPSCVPASGEHLEVLLNGLGLRF